MNLFCLLFVCLLNCFAIFSLRYELPQEMREEHSQLVRHRPGNAFGHASGAQKRPRTQTGYENRFFRISPQTCLIFRGDRRYRGGGRKRGRGGSKRVLIRKRLGRGRRFCICGSEAERKAPSSSGVGGGRQSAAAVSQIRRRRFQLPQSVG